MKQYEQRIDRLVEKRMAITVGIFVVVATIFSKNNLFAELRELLISLL